MPRAQEGCKKLLTVFDQRYPKIMDSQIATEMEWPAVSEDGVDLTLIRSMLALTPAEHSNSCSVLYDLF